MAYCGFNESVYYILGLDLDWQRFRRARQESEADNAVKKHNGQKKAPCNGRTLATIGTLTAFSSLGLNPALVGITTRLFISERLFNTKGGVRPFT